MTLELTSISDEVAARADFKNSLEEAIEVSQPNKYSQLVQRRILILFYLTQRSHRAENPGFPVQSQNFCRDYANFIQTGDFTVLKKESLGRERFREKMESKDFLATDSLQHAIEQWGFPLTTRFFHYGGVSAESYYHASTILDQYEDGCLSVYAKYGQAAPGIYTIYPEDLCEPDLEQYMFFEPIML